MFLIPLRGDRKMQVGLLRRFSGLPGQDGQSFMRVSMLNRRSREGHPKADNFSLDCKLCQYTTAEMKGASARCEGFLPYSTPRTGISFTCRKTLSWAVGSLSTFRGQEVDDYVVTDRQGDNKGIRWAPFLASAASSPIITNSSSSFYV